MKIKIKNSRLAGIHNALIKLEEPGKDREGRPVYPIYQEPGKVRYNLARTMANLKDRYEVLEKCRTDLMTSLLDQQKKKHSDWNDERNSRLEGEFAQTFLLEFNKVLDQEEEIEIRPVKIEWLDLDKNSISWDIIADLIRNGLIDDSSAEILEEQEENGNTRK
jgi:hypothetical protein